MVLRRCYCLPPQQALPVCLSQLRDDATSFLPSAAESNARFVDTPFQTHTHPTQPTASLRAWCRRANAAGGEQRHRRVVCDMARE
jgi:hypothetical protein